VDLFFATTNPGKLRELRRLVAGLAIRVVSPEDLSRVLPDVDEDGDTFQENAEKKASTYARLAGMHALADDSGLSVDALGGAAIRSARWSDEARAGAGDDVRARRGGRRQLGRSRARRARGGTTTAASLARRPAASGAARRQRWSSRWRAPMARSSRA
jgi:XTP/dITP diphosphohydrolase